MRYRRVDGANSVQAHYQVVEPASAADADWVAFPGAATFLDLNPSGGVRRDSTGSRIGLIAQDNWPGGRHLPVERRRRRSRTSTTSGSPRTTARPARTHTAPTTTATTAPAAPNGSNGWFTSDVNVTLAGTDNAGGAGIDKTEYRVDGGAFATYTAPIVVSTPGTHTIEYRSTDKNGNVEATKTAHGQGRQGRAVHHRHALAGFARPGRHVHRPGRPHADRDRRDLRRRQDRVPGQRSERLRCLRRGEAGLRGGRRVRHVRPGQQAVVHGSGRLLDRLPLGRRGRQRGDGEDGHLHDRRVNSDHTAPVTTGTLDPGHARRRPHVLGPGHGEVLGQRSGSGRPGAPRTSTSTPSGDQWARTPRRSPRGPDHLELPVRDRRVPARRLGRGARWQRRHATQVTTGLKFPGDPPVSKTFTETGTWKFFCKIHRHTTAGA